MSFARAFRGRDIAIPAPPPPPPPPAPTAAPRIASPFASREAPPDGTAGSSRTRRRGLSGLRIDRPGGGLNIPGD